MVIPNFVTQALAERPITVYGDGTQRRCFCHVADVVRALADLMERDDGYGEVFNIGSSDEIDIRQLAQRVLEATGSTSEVTLVPYDVAYEEGFEDMQRRIPDTTKIRERIGWEPTRSLDQILADVIDEHRAGAYAA
jgi:UDP-glucose 4-epimerase